MTQWSDWRRRFAQGDEAAFRSLVELTTARLFRLALRLTGSAQDAEDALQESYLRAYGAISERRFEDRAALETWLHRIVTNASLDVLRRRKVRNVVAPPGPVAAADAHGQLEARVALERVQTRLAELPVEQRAALVLKEVEGLSSAEVGRLLGCSEGAVEQRLVRARSNLRKGDHDS